MVDHHIDYEFLADTLNARGVDMKAVKSRLKAQRIATPRWGYANSGTRFEVFARPGAAAGPGGGYPRGLTRALEVWIT